jgi:hypothetical protein
MKAIPYKWANNLFDKDETAKPNTEQEIGVEQLIDMEQTSSANITHIVELIEKLIDLTIEDSNHAKKVTIQLLQQADMI